MRQVKAGEKSRSAKTCSACGAKMWLWDAMMLRWSGPWHFQDCPTVPGGEELSVRNIEDKMVRADEAVVPKKQGARIMKAIMLLIDSPSREVMLKRKAVIHEEIDRVANEQGKSLERITEGATDD